MNPNFIINLTLIIQQVIFKSEFMKWHNSLTRKFTIMNYSKLIKNLKRELIKYPIKRDGDNNSNQ